MKKRFPILLLMSLSLTLFGQPCKLVKPGMDKAQVISLVGNPAEIDTVISPDGFDKGEIVSIVWQYGDVTNYGHQRIEFDGDIVSKEVIADGKKFDDLMRSFELGEFPASELDERI
ncbi:MAG: hypothetical protein EYC69_12295 [Bacteroidetes bacterium]|nr:MAG: hypothetical protein EYC69_12295 [Bacteroidota bacterium]